MSPASLRSGTADGSIGLGRASGRFHADDSHAPADDAAVADLGPVRSVVRVEGTAHVPTNRLVDMALFSLASMTSNAASSDTLLPSYSYATFLAGAQATISIFLMGLLGFVAESRIRR